MSDYDSIFSMRKWHHVAVCRSGSLMQAFVDGALIGEDTSASHSYAGGTLRVGADNITITTHLLVFSWLENNTRTSSVH